MSLIPFLAPDLQLGRADEVVRRISEAIHLGLLSDGERLPVEIELAAQFGVAPMTVREALATLREHGLVQTKRGRTGGSFVVRPDEPPVGLLTQKLRDLTSSDLRDLVDEHVGIAGRAARLAAERVSPASVRRLFSLTEQLAAADSLRDRIRADSRFHIEIAVASQSARLTRHEANLQAEVSGMLWLPIGPPIDVDALVDEHHAIAAAVMAEDGSSAQELAERHVTGNLLRLTALRLGLADAEVQV